MHYMLWLILSALAFATGEFASKKFINTNDFRFLLLTFFSYNFGIVAWFPALTQRNQLAIVGTLWSLMSLVATVAIGTLVFNEKLTVIQFVGIGLALASVAILSQ